MATYLNKNIKSPLVAMELVPVSDGNFAFFHVAGADAAAHWKQWLTSEGGQEVVAETQLDGKTVFVTHGEKTSAEMLAWTAKSGEAFEPEKTKQTWDPWAWRGNFSNIGQSLNLISAYRKPGGIDAPKLTFAALNFAASYINATFGGQKREDGYQLLHLKEQLNERLGTHLPVGLTPPSTDDDRSKLREEAPKPKTLSERGYDMMKANSVSVGEIGLRYLGSIAMAFPVKNWGAAMVHLRKGAFGNAFNAARNKDSTNFATGALYLTGKTVGLFSKVPDPYNPEPTTWVDTVREKYLFRLSSLIEMGAAGVLAYGNFKPDAKTGKRDYIGAAGGATVASGLGIRLFAKFGTREVDKDELYAHVTDVLAQIPSEQLPQAIAESASYIKEHFKGTAKSYSEIYTRIMTELYRYHHVALDNLGTEPDEREAKILAACEAAAPQKPIQRKIIEARSATDFADRVKSEPSEMVRL